MWRNTAQSNVAEPGGMRIHNRSGRRNVTFVLTLQPKGVGAAAVPAETAHNVASLDSPVSGARSPFSREEEQVNDQQTHKKVWRRRSIPWCAGALYGFRVCLPRAAAMISRDSVAVHSQKAPFSASLSRDSGCIIR